MDKQKQIEEIVKIHCQDCGVCENCKFLGYAYDDFEIGRIDCIDYFFAEALYNAGYRKSPENAVVLTREEYENLSLKLFEYEVSISRDYVEQDIFDEVLDEKIDKENENYFLHDKVKALEELVVALRRHIEAYKEQVEALKEFNDVSCKKTRKETADKFAKDSKQRLTDKLHRGKALHTTVLGKEYVRRIFKEVINEICEELTEVEG